MSNLRRFLVVGCGGSGAATLAHMMDELRSELRAVGVMDLPEGWQFVDVDVPVTPQGIGSGIPNVQGQGGTYLGLGANAATYSLLDSAMSGSAGLVNRFSPWAVRRPEEWNISISQGAGQVRAIGRMVTLNRLKFLKEGVARVWDRLNSAEAHASMEQVASSLRASYQQNADPLILIVSSMAGGAGASMALDVARVLATLPGYPALNAGMFMVAADVFNSLPSNARSGVRPNSLAMLGEIVAAQTAAASAHDLEDLRQAGLTGTAAVPFKRVFPVSAHVGKTQAPFGRGTPGDVYRGLARGLAALMTSPSAIAQYETYDLANATFLMPIRNSIGWAASARNLDWGSFGFATLNMGRDRYAEYSAQRLARGAVGTLLDGHRVDAPDGEDGATSLRRLIGLMWPRVAESLQLFDPHKGGAFGAWLATNVWLSADTLRTADDLVAETTANLPAPDGAEAAQWLGQVDRRLRELAPSNSGQTERRVREWLWQHHQDFKQRVLDQLEWAVSQYGIPFGLEVINNLKSALAGMGDAAAQQGGKPGGLAVPEKVTQFVAGIKGRVSNGQNLIQALREGLARSVQIQLYSRLAANLRELWRDFSENVLDGLASELQAKQSMLLAQVERPPSKLASLAVVATEEFAHWPPVGDARVPSRFDEAFNEVLVTSSGEFRTQFDRDITRLDGGGKLTVEADAWPMIIRGQWPTGDGAKPPRGLLTTRTEWVPQLFETDPGTGLPLVPRAAKVTAQVLCADLLGRARGLVARKGYSFRDFCDESLWGYVAQAPQQEIGERRARIAAKFRQTLTMALPLTGPNRDIVRQLYDRDLQYRYKFSAIPFQQDPVLVDELMRIVTTDAEIDQAVVPTNLDEALTTSDAIKRIDVFGSYPCYLPVCFASVLDPIAEELAAVTEGSRKSFWEGRRARSLPASLPMSNEERRALVGGWFVGQITGKVRFVDVRQVGARERVEVYDTVAKRWLEFPELLTPFADRRSAGDLLPSVLEGYLIALVQVGAPGAEFASLQPYQALRRLFDSYAMEPTTHGLLEAELQLAETLRGGSDFMAHSRVKGLTEESVPEDRAKRIDEFLGTVAAILHSLKENHAVVTQRQAGANRPSIVEVADDCLWALERLQKAVPTALDLAKESGTKNSRPDFEIPVI